MDIYQHADMAGLRQRVSVYMSTVTTHAPARSLLADPGFGPLPGLLLILTAVTGVVDAVSILALGRARKLAVPDMTTTVLTMTLTGLGDRGSSTHKIVDRCAH